MDFLFYFNLHSFLIYISLFLMFCLWCFLIIISILAYKNKDYRNKKIFIISKKFINILFFLHMVLTLISILINIFRAYFREDFIIIDLIIGVVGIAIIYGICYILDKNNIDKPNIRKIINMIIRIIFYIIIPIGIICLLITSLYSIFRDSIRYLGDSISLLIITVFVLLSISFLLFYFLAISKLDKNFISIKSKLDKDNKSNFSSELETTKKDNNDNDYII